MGLNIGSKITATDWAEPEFWVLTWILHHQATPRSLDSAVSLTLHDNYVESSVPLDNQEERATLKATWKLSGLCNWTGGKGKSMASEDSWAPEQPHCLRTQSWQGPWDVTWPTPSGRAGAEPSRQTKRNKLQSLRQETTAQIPVKSFRFKLGFATAWIKKKRKRENKKQTLAQQVVKVQSWAEKWFHANRS